MFSFSQSGEIYFHIGNAEDFLLRLGRDLPEAQHTFGFRFKEMNWTGTDDPR